MELYPGSRLDGLLELTDETGILQHTKFTIMDRRFGYSTDDNARALLAAIRHLKIFKREEALRLAKTYLTFLLHMHREDGRYHNFLGYNREYQDRVGTDDSLGHSLWALGETMNSGSTDEMRKLAKWLFDNSLPQARKSTSPRARASALLGLAEYLKANPNDDNVKDNIFFFANHLVDQYHLESDTDWRWFEAYLTYANPRIPQSLLEAYCLTAKEEYLEVSRESLDFLINIQFVDAVFQPVGNESWYYKDGEKSKYDQQPIEASCMVDSAVKLGEISQESKYFDIAANAFRWYYGQNTENVSLINYNNFTCYDGLTREGLNLNQGAESTISYYLAYYKLKQYGLIP